MNKRWPITWPNKADRRWDPFEKKMKRELVGIIGEESDLWLIIQLIAMKGVKGWNWEAKKRKSRIEGNTKTEKEKAYPTHWGTTYNNFLLIFYYINYFNLFFST